VVQLSEQVQVCLLVGFWHTSGMNMKSTRGVDITMVVLGLLAALLVEGFWVEDSAGALD
jgi:hypothetical protein